MKINFKGEKRIEDMYKVGNVIKSAGNSLFLVVGAEGDGYALVNLTENYVTRKLSTLGELANVYGDEDDVLVHAEINIL